MEEPNSKEGKTKEQQPEKYLSITVNIFDMFKNYSLHFDKKAEILIKEILNTPPKI